MGSHAPVMYEEVLRAFACGVLPQDSSEPASTYLDCTFGGGGHTVGLLEQFPEAKVISLDCDPEAVARAKSVQDRFGDRFQFISTNFAQISEVIHEPLDGILFDLGLSSFQFDTAERGFSFRADAPVDMRLNPDEGQSAADFLETASEQELVTAIRNYGEETHWRRVVKAIIQARGTGALQQTLSLAAMIEKAIGAKAAARMKIHPATRSFMGIRIAVNQELAVIEEALPRAFRLLKPRGLLAVISFHSLEDRLVKRFFRKMQGRPETRFDSRPQQLRKQYAEAVTRKPLTPSSTEVDQNPRARSAKLRIIQKK